MTETARAVAIGRRIREDVLGPMKATFVAKDEVVDLLGTCLVAGEHLFLLGPPGTAKSALVHELSRRIEGQDFSYLLTRFTEPSELFGPLDIRKLREGELVTNTEGMLPEASLVFLDELLNANSAILNSLLNVLNERVFRRGRETRKLPLLMVVGASNRLPEDDALGALFDRFLVRVICDNVPEERLGEVLRAGWRLESGPEEAGRPVSVDEVRELHRALPAVDLTPIHAQFVETVRRVRNAGIAVSDRRAVKLQRLVAASALLCERDAAHVSDLWVFRYIWDTEQQHEILSGLVDDAIARAADDGATVHPRAQSRAAPDPEALARELDEIGGRLHAAADDRVACARLRDRVAAIAGRCEWVREDGQREFLTGRVEAMWKKLESLS